ncbi:MAG TPA: hypothetical protein VIK59_10880 [Verrucomicrobiae bacterium]
MSHVIVMLDENEAGKFGREDIAAHLSTHCFVKVHEFDTPNAEPEHLFPEDLVEIYVQEQITPQGFGDFYKPAEARLNQLVAELPKLQAEVDFLKINKLSADDVLHEANTLYDRWPKLPVQDKRKIVEALIEKIVIGDGEIDITFSHLPSSEELCKNQQKLILKCR